MPDQTLPLAELDTDGRQQTRKTAHLAPAFNSTAQKAGFVALVLISLLLPVLIAKSGRLTRRDSYEIMQEMEGPYSFVENEIFNTKENLDILFVGNSFLWEGIDTPIVEEALSKKLSRPVRAATFGSNWPGMDIPYTQIRDLLDRKNVKLIVLSIPRGGFPDGPPPVAFKFLRYGEYRDITNGLPFKYRISTYAGNVLRSPHDLLTLVRRNRTVPSPYAENLGALPAKLGWGQSTSTFEQFSPTPPLIPVSNMIYAPSTRGEFQFTNDAVPPYHQYYLMKIVQLLNAKGVHLVILNVPVYSERHNPSIVERVNWPEVLGAKISLVGVQPSLLFDGLNEEQLKKLYYNEHFSKNGCEFFTRTILPAILEVYTEHVENN